MRLSYVIWQEEVTPLILVELLSPGTERQDLGEDAKEADGTPSKWEVYEKILRVLYYVVFSRYTDQSRAFELIGDRYEPVELVAKRLPIPEAELSLGLWQGNYRGSSTFVAALVYPSRRVNRPGPEKINGCSAGISCCQTGDGKTRCTTASLGHRS